MFMDPSPFASQSAARRARFQLPRRSWLRRARAAYTARVNRAPDQSATSAPAGHVGPLLRHWRAARRVSQLDLALDADVSSRHLSFVETGRAQPSREMVLRLAEALAVPLRERNSLLLAAGYAP